MPGSARPQHPPLPAGEGVDSDGTLYPSAAKPAAAAPGGALICVTADAPAGPLSDAGSVPDIDSVSAPATAPRAPATAQAEGLGFREPTAVPEVSSSLLQRPLAKPRRHIDRRAVAGQSTARCSTRCQSGALR